MIIDSIENRDNYKDFHLLYRALKYLASLSSDKTPASNTVFIPDILYCNVVNLTSKPEAECIYEAHRNYIDLHYIVSGIEGIATSDITDLTSVVPYSREKDIEFLTGAESGRYYLKPGQFMVCFPNDAHKVAIMKNQPAKIEKIVFKIKYPALSSEA